MMLAMLVCITIQEISIIIIKPKVELSFYPSMWGQWSSHSNENIDLLTLSFVLHGINIAIKVAILCTLTYLRCLKTSFIRELTKYTFYRLIIDQNNSLPCSCFMK